MRKKGMYKKIYKALIFMLCILIILVPTEHRNNTNR